MSLSVRQLRGSGRTAFLTAKPPWRLCEPFTDILIAQVGFGSVDDSLRQPECYLAYVLGFSFPSPLTHNVSMVGAAMKAKTCCATVAHAAEPAKVVKVEVQCKGGVRSGQRFCFAVKDKDSKLH
jgi:hypothetical protein